MKSIENRKLVTIFDVLIKSKQKESIFICAVRKLSNSKKKVKVCTANEKFSYKKKTPLQLPPTL